MEPITPHLASRTHKHVSHGTTAQTGLLKQLVQLLNTPSIPAVFNRQTVLIALLGSHAPTPPRTNVPWGVTAVMEWPRDVLSTPITTKQKCHSTHTASRVQRGIFAIRKVWATLKK